MIPLGGRSRIIRKSADLVFFTSGPTRRLMFFLLFLLLTITMVFGTDLKEAFSGATLLRTIGYVAVLLALLGAAGWSTKISINREEGSVETISSVFGVTVRRSLLVNIDSIEGVVMQKVSLLRGNFSRGGRSGIFGNLFEPPSQLFRLFLETNDERIRIDEGGEAGRFEKIGRFFAEFLDVGFSEEELETGP